MEDKNKNIEEIKNGSLLISMPFLGDPNFERTVVLICEHNNEGSFGLILNKESDFKIQDFNLFNNLNFDENIFIGGPVQHNTIHFLHGYTDLSNALEVSKKVYWGGTFKDLKKKVEADKVKNGNIRFYLGYSGWEAGQIEDEIAQNSWVVNNNYSINLFKIEPQKLWKTILKDMGGKYVEIANYPIDPSLN